MPNLPHGTIEWDSTIKHRFRFSLRIVGPARGPRYGFADYPKSCDGKDL